MQVGVEDPVDEYALQHPGDQGLGEFRPLRLREGVPSLCHRHAAQPGRHHDGLAGEIVDGLRHLDEGVSRGRRANGSGVVRLPAVVELLEQRTGESSRQRLDVHRAGPRPPTLSPFGEAAQDVAVDPHIRRSPRTTHLDDDVGAVREHRSVDLGERRRGQRLRRERLQDRVGGAAPHSSWNKESNVGILHARLSLFG